MIEINELRKGIIVYVNNPKHHPKLKNIPLGVTGFNQTIDTEGKNTYSVNLEHLNQKENTYYPTYSQFINFIEPVRLTDKILTNIGYPLKDVILQSGSYQVYKFGDKFQGSFSQDGRFHFGYDSFHFGGCTSIKMMYLHQLQNAFFILNNFKEELPIKNN